MPAPSDPNPGSVPDDDDEDDYMKMTFDDPAPTVSSSKRPETSLQRRLRLQREGEARAKVKSKAELAAEAEAAREKALRTSLLESTSGKKSKGLAMMAKMGFKGGRLGRQDGDGVGLRSSTDGNASDGSGGKEKEKEKAEPIRIEVKDDRGGIGMESEKKRKMAEAFRDAEETAKKVKVDEIGYRERVRREREVARLERQVMAAQNIAERMDEEKDAADGEEGPSITTTTTTTMQKGKGGVVSSQPLNSINVLWRGLVRSREEKERDRRMRYDLEQSLSSRLPTYGDDDEDEDDKMALGKEKKTVYEVAEDLDEDDEELAAFDALEPEEKLRRLVMHLREAHRYCFWCKFTYPDREMEGCPGLTEEDHD